MHSSVTEPETETQPKPRRAQHGLTRRAALKASVGALAGPRLVAPAQAQQVDFPSLLRSVLGEGKSFDSNLVVELARQLARRPFMAPAADLPDNLRSLSFEQYQAIRMNRKDRAWEGENRGFVVEPLHRGFVYQNRVTIYVVEDGAVRRLAYDASRFDFGALQAPTQADLDYSGFKIMYRDRGTEGSREIASFQGASFFRGLAKGQVPGVLARGLTLRPAEARGEEFPLFRAFWIERPGLLSDEIVAHALLDSDSVCGAYRFTIRPREETIIDVEGTIFARSTLDHVGYGGMAGMFLFGPASHRMDDDVRPAVHDANGLQLHTGSGQWIWRPLANPEALQISVFVDQNPKGFGLLQRDRDFSVYQDDDRAFERRPSLWVEPIGDWGQGAVQLLEIPSDNETNANILSYWRPTAQIAANTQASFAFRQFWTSIAPDRPSQATVSMTRTGRGTTQNRRRFVVDFTSPKFTSQAAIADISAAASAAKGNVSAVRLLPHFERNVLRVSFELDPGGEALCELRLVLMESGKAASETWLYRWTS
ncbi:MAG: glucan biosynthesis protein [Hyphomicrobiales bacterium]